MNYAFLILGILLPVTAHAQLGPVEKPIYEVILEQEKAKYSQLETPLAIEKYVPLIFPEEHLDIEREDVDRALQNQRTEICRPEINDGDLVNEQRCSSTVKLAKELVENNNWLRSTIRDFQLSATSYEMAAANNTGEGHSTTVLTKIPSISKLWLSDAGPLGNLDVSMPVRGGQYPNGIDSALAAIANDLQRLIVQDTNGKMDYEKFVAAVWRYRHGVESVTNAEGSCGDSESDRGNGTDLQFLEARFCTLENILSQILIALPKSANPPLRPNERIVFPALKIDDLPVQFWARSDDVGLQWTVQLDPVLPSLNCSDDYSNEPKANCKDDAIFSNGYPPEVPEPEHNEGLCSHPAAQRGYLCRKRYNPKCPEEEGNDSILLTDCSTPDFDSAPIRFTESGPNICGEAGWRAEVDDLPNDTPAVDDTLERDECSHCYVDLVCGSCPPETGQKEDDGRIEACIDEAFESLANYIIIRELVHAQQQCDSPPGPDTIWRQKYDTINGCCASEYQASLAACNAMAEDGILQEVGIEIADCATTFSNFQCEAALQLPASTEPGTGICGDTGIEMLNLDILSKIRDYIDENSGTLNIPTTCSDAVNDLDPRAKSILYSMPQVCSPDCTTKYQNTIGNAACHIGQCVEQSVEEHRVTPGRVTWTPQDQAFPWDAEKEAPIYDKSNALTPPHAIPLPSYKPQLLAEQMDKALCQMLGLPTQTPPTLCTFDPRRRLYLPAKGVGAFALNFGQQDEEADLPQDALKNLAEGVGSRIGSDLYARYFQLASRSLADVIRNANAILTSLEEVSFPEEMCRRIN